jgi:hypothetical protein
LVFVLVLSRRSDYPRQGACCPGIFQAQQITTKVVDNLVPVILVRDARAVLTPCPAVNQPTIAIEEADGSAAWIARLPARHKKSDAISSITKLGPGYPHGARVRYVTESGELTTIPNSEYPENEGRSTPLWLTSLPAPEKITEDSGSTAFVIPNAESVEVLRAYVPLKTMPELNEDGGIILPAAQIATSVQLVEHLLDLMSIASRSSRALTSPRAPVGLLAETDQELNWLERTAGIIGLNAVDIRSEHHHHVDIHGITQTLVSTRPDGVASLADVYSQSWPAGRYRELVRFFELAFALPTGRLSGPFISFLRGNEFGFTGAEVHAWLSTRGQVIHADRGSNPESMTRVIKYVARMELAALDLLLHKKEWHSPSAERIDDDAGDHTVADLRLAGASFSIWPEFGTGPTHLVDDDDGVAIREEGYWAKPFGEPTLTSNSEEIVK